MRDPSLLKTYLMPEEEIVDRAAFAELDPFEGQITDFEAFAKQADNLLVGLLGQSIGLVVVNEMINAATLYMPEIWLFINNLQNQQAYKGVQLLYTTPVSTSDKVNYYTHTSLVLDANGSLCVKHEIFFHHLGFPNTWNRKLKQTMVNEGYVVFLGDPLSDPYLPNMEYVRTCRTAKKVPSLVLYDAVQVRAA